MTLDAKNPALPSIDNRQSQIDNPRLLSIMQAIECVTDPEIPVLSVIDMGIIADVRITDHNVTVDVTPTFVGCPAVDTIRDNIRLALATIGEHVVDVNVVYNPPWTSDRFVAGDIALPAAT